MADGLSLDNLFKQPVKAKRPGVAETTTALGQTVGGASPDQAKMAGTPNQIAGAAEHNAAAAAAPSLPKLASEKKTSGFAFSDALRMANPAALNATLEEEKQKSRLERESVLGKARMEVKDLISQATAGEELKVKPMAEEADITSSLKAVGLVPQDIELADINSVATSVANMTESQQKEVLSKLAVTSQEVHDQLVKKLQENPIVVKNQLKSMADSLGFKDEAAQKSFYDTTAKDLGLASADELLNMTPDMFMKTLEESISKDVSQVKELNTKLASPAASPAEKTAARAELMRLGATGMRTLAEETEALKANLNTMDDIYALGKTYKNINELLSDKDVSALILRAFDSDPNNKEDQLEATKQLKEAGLLEPGGLIEKYGKAIKEKLTKDKEGLQSIIDGQKEVASLFKISDTLSLSPLVAQHAMKTGTGKANLSTLDPSVSNFMKLVKTGSMSSSDKDELVSGLNELASLGHSDIIKAVVQSPDVGTIQAMIPNLKYAANMEKAQKVFDRLPGTNEITMKDLKSLEQFGLVSGSDLDLYEAAGVPASTIYQNIVSNINTIEEWMQVSPEMKGFATAIFKPRKYELSQDYLVNAIDSLTEDKIDRLYTISTTAPSPTLQQKAKQKINVIKTDFTNKEVARLSNEAPRILMASPENMQNPEQYRTEAMAFNTGVDVQIENLKKLLSEESPNILKVNKDIVANKIEELQKSKITEDKIKATQSAIVAKVAREAEEKRKAEAEKKSKAAKKEAEGKPLTQYAPKGNLNDLMNEAIRKNISGREKRPGETDKQWEARLRDLLTPRQQKGGSYTTNYGESTRSFGSSGSSDSGVMT